MINLTLTDSQLFTLTNALSTAAETYEGHANELEAIKPQLIEAEKQDPEGFRIMHSSACDRLAEQFRLQSDNARQLIQMLWDVEEEAAA